MKKNKNKIYSLLSCLITVFFVASCSAIELSWDWDTINLDRDNFFNYAQYFPTDFMWGAASSAYQAEGTKTANGKHCKNNWTEDTTKPVAGIACGNWDKYKEDVQLMKQLGMNAYRFSIEWSKIEPIKGVFDKKAMKHYSDLVAELRKNGIEPIVCLWHHTWPEWFGKKGGFLYEENISDFIEFAQYVFKHLKGNIRYWMTFNEPEGYALEGYFRGHYPPGKQHYPELKKLGMPEGLVRLKAAGIFLNNCLKAHIIIYQKFKKIDSNLSIGLVKVMNPIEPYHSWNPVETMAAKIFDYLLNDVMLNFFTTGQFRWLSLVHDSIKEAPECIDFIGISYYTNTLLKQSLNGKMATAVRPGQKVSDSGKAIYPEGLYRSVQKQQK